MDTLHGSQNHTRHLHSAPTPRGEVSPRTDRRTNKQQWQIDDINVPQSWVTTDGYPCPQQLWRKRGEKKNAKTAKDTKLFQGFQTRIVYLDYITCLRYNILVWNPTFFPILFKVTSSSARWPATGIAREQRRRRRRRRKILLPHWPLPEQFCPWLESSSTLSAPIPHQAVDTLINAAVTQVRVSAVNNFLMK